jgi:hypothetical protein
MTQKHQQLIELRAIRASLDAVRQFKFEPRMEQGVAVASPGVQHVFRFTLE